MMADQASAVVAVPRRRRPKVNADHPIYEIDLWLIDSDPPIWRTLAVPANLTLGMLHHLIQIVMRWEDAHLHQFETKSGRCFEPRQQVGGVDAMWRMMVGQHDRVEDERRVTLRDVFDELKQKIVYVYDFGDSWAHGIKLINTHADASAFARVPVCLAGQRAGPPEDCGGIWGYQEKLEILRNPDPEDEWHQEIIEWMGGEDYDPEAFDLAEKNRHIDAAWRARSRSSSRGGRRGGTKRRRRKSR